jgi:DNA repair protein RadC
MDLLHAPYIINDYTYTIHDRPPEKAPFKRLQTEGADVLEVNELLQIAMGKVDGFEDVLRQYGVAFLTTLHSVTDIMEVLHLDQIQATKLLAILGLGKQLYTPSQGSLPFVRGIEDIHFLYGTMANLTREQLRILLIDSRYKLIHEETLAIGATEHLNVPMLDILQPAVERRINAFILIHNHPSGDSTPSTSDLQFTHRVQEAAKVLDIDLLDHVIIARDGYFSCLNNIGKRT